MSLSTTVSFPFHDQDVGEKLCTTIKPAYMDADLYIYKVWIHPASSIMTSLEGRRELPLYCSDTTTRHTTMCHRDSLSPAVYVFLRFLLSSPPHCFQFSLHPCFLSLFHLSSRPLSSFSVLAHRPAAVSLVKHGLNEPW